DFFQSHQIRINNRPLELKKVSDGLFLAGLRYRRTNLHPSLHPGLPPQVPLVLDLISQGQSRRYILRAKDCVFRKLEEVSPGDPGKPCKSGQRGDLTYDLRIP
ncbi:MAG: transglutaminase family protein, partial [Terrimicrobiaceae bacterium]|nr:transglutaminase family protein [Terrimicrobiaceae bacterium]